MNRTMIFTTEQAVKMVESAANQFLSIDGIREFIDSYRKEIAALYPHLSQAKEAIEDKGIDVGHVVSILNTNLNSLTGHEFKAMPTPDGKSVLVVPTEEGKFSFFSFFKEFRLDKDDLHAVNFYNSIVLGKQSTKVYDVIDFINQAQAVSATHVTLTQDEVTLLNP